MFELMKEIEDESNLTDDKKNLNRKSVYMLDQQQFSLEFQFHRKRFFKL